MEERSFQLNDRVQVTDRTGSHVRGRIISRTFQQPMLYDVESDEQFRADRMIIKYVEGDQLHHV